MRPKSGNGQFSSFPPHSVKDIFFRLNDRCQENRDRKKVDRFPKSFRFRIFPLSPKKISTAPEKIRLKPQFFSFYSRLRPHDEPGKALLSTFELFLSALTRNNWEMAVAGIKPMTLLSQEATTRPLTTIALTRDGSWIEPMAS